MGGDKELQEMLDNDVREAGKGCSLLRDSDGLGKAEAPLFG